MSKILFCGYRSWAEKIYYSLVKKNKYNFAIKLIKTPEELADEIKAEKPLAMFFVGWSWIVKKDIVDSNLCVCLHPSPLPKYRGGSPIQHQIINGEIDSAVTLFKMDEHIDRGEILFQQSFSLQGNLDDIFSRITDAGGVGIEKIIDNISNSVKIDMLAQDEKKATYYKRRTPDMSEIKVNDILNSSAKEIYNKIRALQDPYPNAYIVCGDGSKLFLQSASLEERDE
jgi:methionyl-tRNA formyltransferase